MDPALVIIFLPVLLFSLTIHEAAHAWAAWRLGDPTARMLGRLTLNPFPHLDIWGALMLVASGFRFGWAKPVPVDPRHFADPRRGMFLTATAGPTANILLAVVCGLVLRGVLAAGWGGSPADGFISIIGRIVALALVMNLSLAFFNLIPLPPLDGSQILYGLAPRGWERGLMQLQRVGPMILMALILMGFLAGFSPIWLVIGPIVGFLAHLIVGVPLGVLYAMIHS